MPITERPIIYNYEEMLLLLLIRTGQDYYSLNEQRKTHYIHKTVH